MLIVSSVENQIVDFDIRLLRSNLLVVHTTTTNFLPGGGGVLANYRGSCNGPASNSREGYIILCYLLDML